MEGTFKLGSSEHKCASPGDQGISSGVVCGSTQEPNAGQDEKRGDARMDLHPPTPSSTPVLPSSVQVGRKSSFQEKFEQLSEIQKTNICRLFPGVSQEFKTPVKIEQCQAEEDEVLDDSGEELSDEEWSESETECEDFPA